MKERRQAGAVIFREAHPGYIMPVGVWNVRENVRKALTMAPTKFNNINEALAHVQGRMEIPLSRWIGTSEVVKDLMRQRRIDDYA